MESENQQYSNSALRQQIDQYFSPADDWQDCELPLVKEELWEQVYELLPGYFESYTKLHEILLSLNFKYSFNEHNRKYYWLVNPKKNTVVY